MKFIAVKHVDFDYILFNLAWGYWKKVDHLKQNRFIFLQ